MSRRILGFFGIGIQSMTLVVILVGLTVLFLPSLLENRSREVVIDHEKLDLGEETRQRAWEILDRIDTLRLDTTELVFQWEHAPAGGSPAAAQAFAQRYLRVEIWPVSPSDATALPAGSKPVFSDGLARFDPANASFRRICGQLLATRPERVVLSEIEHTAYTLEKPDPELGTWKKLFVVWAGRYLPGHDDPAAGQMVMVAMALDEALFDITGSTRHLGIVVDQTGRVLVHPLGGTAHWNLQSPLAAQVTGGDPRQAEVLRLFQNHFPGTNGTPDWLRKETLRLQLGPTLPAGHATIALESDHFYFGETGFLLLPGKTDAEQERWRRRLEAALRKLNAIWVSEVYQTDPPRPTRVWGFDQTRPTVRLFVGGKDLGEGKRNLEEALNRVREHLAAVFRDDPEVVALARQVASCREVVECGTCELTWARVRLDPPAPGAEGEPGRFLVVGRAQFREELDWDLDREMLGVRRLAWGWALAAALLALVASLVITRPLKRMTSAALSVADLQAVGDAASERWDQAYAEVSRRLPTRRQDEIGVLARALDQMLCEVRDSHAQLLTLNRQLEGRVRDRTRELSETNAKLEATIAQLQTTNEALQEAHEARQQLVSSLSHDLMQPLSIVKGYAELLLQSASLPEEQRDDVETIYEAYRRLARLIADIRDSEKIDVRQLRLDIKKFDPGELIRQFCRSVTPSIEKGGNTLRVNVPDQLPRMTSDPDRITRVLANLLSNAAKFTKNGRIDVSAEAVDDLGKTWLVVRVADTGRGIDPAKRDRVFQRHPGILSKAENPDGSGLGLFNCKGYCEAMGGTICFESELHRGTTFTFRLPIWMEGPAKAAPGLTPVPVPLAQHVAPPLEQAGASQRRVLVIDDEADMRSLLRRSLEHLGFQVLLAGGGKEGLALARSERPDLITLDAIMPGFDGWTVLKELKADEATSGIPVIMVTSLDEPAKAFALGASDFVTKPIDWERLNLALLKYRSVENHPIVLVVDDDPEIRALAGRYLAPHGWTVVEADNGQAALGMLDCLAPDVVLLDLLMPVMDGFGFLQALRADSRQQALPVVVLTAKDLSDAERERLNGRVLQIVEKSEVHWDELEGELHRLVAQLVTRGEPDRGRGA